MLNFYIPFAFTGTAFIIISIINSSRNQKTPKWTLLAFMCTFVLQGFDIFHRLTIFRNTADCGIYCDDVLPRVLWSNSITGIIILVLCLAFIGAIKELISIRSEAHYLQLAYYVSPLVLIVVLESIYHPIQQYTIGLDKPIEFHAQFLDHKKRSIPGVQMTVNTRHSKHGEQTHKLISDSSGKIFLVDVNGNMLNIKSQICKSNYLFSKPIIEKYEYRTSGQGNAVPSPFSEHTPLIAYGYAMQKKNDHPNELIYLDASTSPDWQTFSGYYTHINENVLDLYFKEYSAELNATGNAQYQKIKPMKLSAQVLSRSNENIKLGIYSKALEVLHTQERFPFSAPTSGYKKGWSGQIKNPIQFSDKHQLIFYVRARDENFEVIGNDDNPIKERQVNPNYRYGRLVIDILPDDGRKLHLFQPENETTTTDGTPLKSNVISAHLTFSIYHSERNLEQYKPAKIATRYMGKCFI